MGQGSPGSWPCRVEGVERKAVRAELRVHFPNLAQTACLSSPSTLQRGHLPGSWTALPHGTSLQDHCVYLSLQKSLWLYDNNTPQCQVYEFFSWFLTWKYQLRLLDTEYIVVLSSCIVYSLIPRPLPSNSIVYGPIPRLFLSRSIVYGPIPRPLF